jgi:ABC-type molybdenum transport system ATPase subunit/photorepair protein PhrA
MKKIISIKLNNFRAFLGLYEPVLLKNGENLLIYGENGSGKSSLFRGLKTFFQSSRNTAIKFEINSESPVGGSGSIDIEFANYDSATKRVIANTTSSHSFNNGISTNKARFKSNF